jgi:ribosomal-protein-serine acetyltransferase
MIAEGTVYVDGELSLVPRHPSDAEEIFAIVGRHRASLGEWLTWIDATRTPADARRYAQFAQVQFESRVAFDYALRFGGAIVGAIGIHGIDWAHRSAQMGYWISPEATGKGIVTRAAAALTAHAFTHLDMHRLEIRCVVQNRKSRAVAERLGYIHEGTLADAYLLHGRFRDISLYATTEGRWASSLTPAGTT